MFFEQDQSKRCVSDTLKRWAQVQVVTHAYCGVGTVAKRALKQLYLDSVARPPRRSRNAQVEKTRGISLFACFLTS